MEKRLVLNVKVSSDYVARRESEGFKVEDWEFDEALTALKTLLKTLPDIYPDVDILEITPN